MSKTSIAVVTSTRADYGLLRPVMERVLWDRDLELRVYVTGAHLMRELGMTVNEIFWDNIPIAEKIDIMSGTDGDDVKAMSNALTMFAELFRRSRPDILVVLGDRYEIFAVCVAAAACGVPIAHISGGETTEGAKDEYYRHCITKMSALHFPAAEIYRRRIIQMGEQPESVITAGALGLENSKKIPVVPAEKLSETVGFDFTRPFILSTYHPETMGEGINGIYPFIEALREVGLPVLFTKSNADVGGEEINRILEEESLKTDGWKLVSNLGAKNYFSALRYTLCMAGNSSSGLTEAPSVGKPTVNVGNRQKGRYACKSVISCDGDKDSIVAALRKAVSDEFQEYASSAGNPFFAGADASEIIIRTIKERLELGIEQSKHFFDISNLNY